MVMLRLGKGNDYSGSSGAGVGRISNLLTTERHDRWAVPTQHENRFYCCCACGSAPACGSAEESFCQLTQHQSLIPHSRDSRTCWATICRAYRRWCVVRDSYVVTSGRIFERGTETRRNPKAEHEAGEMTLRLSAGVESHTTLKNRPQHFAIT